MSWCIRGLKSVFPILCVDAWQHRASKGRFAVYKALLTFLICLVCSPATASSDGTPTVEQYAAHVGGRIIPAGQLVLDGVRLHCGSRPTVLDSSLDDYGAAYPGFLILNPKLIARVPRAVKLWIYSHECAHQFRGPDEEVADCFAVQRGRRQRWLTTDGLDQICKFIEPAKGSSMHYSGPHRCKVMQQCFADRRVR
jgi:hypothetical protein